MSIYHVHPRSLHMLADKAVRCAQWHVQGCDYWYERNPDYNVPGSKLNRGKSVIDAAEIIKGTSLTNDEYLKAAMLGWGIELVRPTFPFFFSNDMMDSLFTCRGQPCWYRIPKVGQIAINDLFMLEAAIYNLKKHFHGESYSVDILGLFLETTFQTEMGQFIENEIDLSKFSLKKYSLIMIYKTAYYAFCLPVALAMFTFCIPQSHPSEKQAIEPYASFNPSSSPSASIIRSKTTFSTRSAQISCITSVHGT
ncbi:Polyprenyl synthetase-domain-containing protein [Armillaria nabsnona]|nr:Polyprenyl synthetase-domain-containing protein [Armillaria nabsnona]